MSWTSSRPKNNQVAPRAAPPIIRSIKRLGSCQTPDLTPTIYPKTSNGIRGGKRLAASGSIMDWINKLFSSWTEAPKGTAAHELLLAFQQELKECEALYRAGARLCVWACPERLGDNPQKFPALMIDLHRGLLVKVLVEIAQADRCWHSAEREFATHLLRHVWGVGVDTGNLARVLQNLSEHAETLKWDSLLSPFVSLPPLAEQVAELNTRVMRIANLIAKADGSVLPGEVQALKSIQAALTRILGRGKPAGTTPRPDVVRAGREVAQVVQVDPAGQPVANRATPSPRESGSIPFDDEKSSEELLAEAMAELEQLVGLDAVKKDIRQLMNFLKIQKERERHKLPTTPVSLHTIFRGNPGTGKTTVARILGRAFGGLGILKKGHTVESDRSGLVAEYAGQTGPKVNRRVEEALDGVLFVDEAYSLISEHGDDAFGSEAVQVLVKRMEDDRHRLVVVLAGYPEPMERMLDSNPGLASRFQRTFDFPDYAAAELVQVFQAMCRKNHYALTPAALVKLRAIFEAAFDARDERFGNGRLARNLFESAIRRMANRIVTIAPITRELLTCLQPDDIHLENN